MLFYNKYTVYTQSLCTEMPAERLIVILESAPCVNQSKVTVTWRLRLKVTHLFHRRAKSGTNEAVDILQHAVCVYQDIYSMYVLSVAVEAAATQLMAPMSLLHASFDTFIIPRLPVSWWTLFLPWTCTQKHITALYHYLWSISAFTNMHK